MEVRASCTFDYNSIKALSHVSLYKKLNPKSVFLFVTIFFVLLIALTILMIVLYGTSESNHLLGLGFAILVLNCFMYLIFPRIQYSNLKKFKNSKNEYLFYDNLIKVSTLNQFYNGECEIQYSLVHKVLETSEYFFIFQNNNAAYVVDKSTIANGGVDAIREKLLEFVGKKYVVCKY